MATKKNKSKKPLKTMSAGTGTQTVSADTIIWLKITPHPNPSAAAPPNSLCVFFSTNEAGPNHYYCFPIANPDAGLAASARAWIDILINSLLTGDTVSIATAPTTTTAVGPLQNPQNTTISEAYTLPSGGVSAVEFANDFGAFKVVNGLSTP